MQHGLRAYRNAVEVLTLLIYSDLTPDNTYITVTSLSYLVSYTVKKVSDFPGQGEFG